MFFSGSGENLQADNTRGRSRTGLVPTPLKKVYDLNAAVGGPIKKDRVWYFVTARTQGSTRAIVNMFYNLNAGDPTKWLYAPDLNQPGFSDRTWENVSGRVTWQVTPRNKIGGVLGRAVGLPEVRGQDDTGSRPRRACRLKRTARDQTLPLRVPQVTWSSPLTNRLLLEAGFGGTYYGWGNFERDPNPHARSRSRSPNSVRHGCPANGNSPGIVYRSQDYGSNYTGSYTWKATAAVRHRGAQHEGRLSGHAHDRRSDLDDEQPESLVSLQQRRAEPAHRDHFAVDQQRPRRLARAVRSRAVDDGPADAAGGAALGHRRAAGSPNKHRARRFLPVAYNFPETKGIDSYKDITPRMGVAYDVFGNGKTAVKMNFGRYLEGVGVQLELREYQSDDAHSDQHRSVRCAWRDAHVDRRQREFPARLRSAESAGQRSPRGRR